MHQIENVTLQVSGGESLPLALVHFSLNSVLHFTADQLKQIKITFWKLNCESL